MHCPYCGSEVKLVDQDEPEVWLETEDGEFLSMHEYQCWADSDHFFYVESCTDE